MLFKKIAFYCMRIRPNPNMSTQRKQIAGFPSAKAGA